MQWVAISLTACGSSAKEPSSTYYCDVIVTLFQGELQTDTKGRARRIFIYVASAHPSFPRVLWRNLLIVRPRKGIAWMIGKVGLQISLSGGLFRVAKAPIILVTSDRLSFHIYQCGSHWQNFHEIWSWGLRWKRVEKMQISLKYVKNIRNSTRRPKYYF